MYVWEVVLSVAMQQYKGNLTVCVVAATAPRAAELACRGQSDLEVIQVIRRSIHQPVAI